MDVQIQMQIWGDKMRHREFYLIAFHAGRIRKRISRGDDWWKEALDDRSVMPIEHIMGRAFKLNHLVIFKQPDEAMQPLIKAHLQKERLDSQVHVTIERGDAAVWQGTDGFDFRVEEYHPNRMSDDRRRFELAHLRIINGTERRMFT